MLATAATLRFLLAAGVIGMALLALVYLSQQRMPFWSYLGYGLLALLVPLLGPFLVILAHPGQPIARRQKLRLPSLRKKAASKLSY